MRCSLVMCLVLTSCTLPAVVSPPHEALAAVTLEHKSDGELAVQVYSFHAHGSLVTRTVDTAAPQEHFFLAAGNYTVQINCLKGFRTSRGEEVRWYVIDAADTFELGVLAGHSYELGCSPSLDGPGFYAAAGT
jgi:hypothetical protein